MARTHVVLSDEVVAEIDRTVGSRARSRFLEEAARQMLARLALEEALEESFGNVSGRDYEHWKDRRSTAAWVRGVRREDRRR